MTEVNQNATMWQGESKSLVFTITGTDPTTATDITWKLTTSNQATTIATKTLADGVTADSSTQLTVTLDPDDTGSVSGKHYHELRITDVSGNEAVVAIGTLTINAGVTD